MAQATASAIWTSGSAGLAGGFFPVALFQPELSAFFATVPPARVAMTEKAAQTLEFCGATGVVVAGAGSSRFFFAIPADYWPWRRCRAQTSVVGAPAPWGRASSAAASADG